MTAINKTPQMTVSDLLSAARAEEIKKEVCERGEREQGLHEYIRILLNPGEPGAAERLADLRNSFPWMSAEKIRDDALAIARFKNDSKNCGAAVRADRAKSRVAAKEARDRARRALEEAEKALSHAATAESNIANSEYRVRDLLRTHSHIFVADANGVAGVSILGDKV